MYIERAHLWVASATDIARRLVHEGIWRLPAARRIRIMPARGRTNMMQLSSGRVFLRSVARDFRRTGAIAPSSRSLGCAMTGELALRPNRPIAVLEVGGGTGSITEIIARRLRPGDRLDVYEIDGELASVIRRRLIDNPRYRESGLSIRVFDAAIESMDPRPCYDFVVSCLPFTNFEAEQVCRILEIYRSCLRPGGVCSFFEYILLRKAAQWIGAGAKERARLASVERVVREFRDRYCYKSDVVLPNLPPAMVYHLRFDRSKVR